MVGKIQIPDDPDGMRFRLLFFKLDAAPGFVSFHTSKIFEKIKMPVSPAEFPVRYRLQADFFLLCHNPFDFLIFYFTQRFFVISPDSPAAPVSTFPA